MQSHHPRARWAWPQVLRATALLTTLVVPAIAVTAVDAAAHERIPRVAGVATDDLTDDMNVVRVALNSARMQAIRTEVDGVVARDAVKKADQPLSPLDRARASRDFARKVLELPQYVRPVPGPVTQWYGYHPGIDIAPDYGTPIGAAHAGIVTFVGWDDGYGMHVEILQSDGFVTTYSHMSGFTVSVGQIVIAGQQIGMVGNTGYSTGPHLHFEVHLPDGSRTDPAAWLREHGVQV